MNEKIRKNIPNLLTFLRIVICPFVFFTKQNVYVSFILILICVLTDILDGYIARRFRLQSSFGAKFDSFADLIFFAMIVFCLFSIMPAEMISNGFWIAGIVLIKAFSVICCRVKNKRIYSLHTYTNKIAGGVVIFGILVFWLVRTDFVIKIITAVAALGALEELLIFILIKNPDPDIKTVFIKKQENTI